MSLASRRLLVAFLLVAIVVTAVVVSPRPSPIATTEATDVITTIPPSELTPAELAPLATSTEAGSSTWFCAGGTATPGGAADQAVVFSNPGEEPATGTVSVFPEGGEATVVPIAIAARTREALVLSTVVDAPHAAAIVELDRGGVVVEHEIRGPGGWDSARCSSQSSPTWYFAWGRTVAPATFELALFNPYPGDAVVDITFDTEDGFASPPALEGFLVPARRLVVVDVTNAVTVRERVATMVVARTGRVVADRVQTMTGTDGTVVLDVSPGATGPALVWRFADGRADAQTVERFAFLNPGEETAEIELSLNRPSSGVGAEIEPFALRIAPNASAEIVVNRESRVALPFRHVATAVSLNGVPFVVERVVGTGTVAEVVAGPAPAAAEGQPTATTVPDPGTGSGAPPATAPATPDAGQAGGGAALVPYPTGLAVTLGSPILARTWVVATAGRVDTLGSKLAIFNPAAETAVSIEVVAYARGTTVPLVAPQDVEPRRRVEIDLTLPDGVASTIVVVEASGPVVVERIQPYLPVPDLTVEPGVPMPEGAEVARPGR